ncbi:hypothetical protein [uncultured Sphingomonas sp.]|uniref:hypothetical protein n=1 Tax=uncultured Sphingomonas sp. TaxID=158754 RepID=UPI002593680B|nr:hypothetical protein [uncultured Sphingomonas sp.]
MTRDTVIGETPASLATSLMVGAEPDRRDGRGGAAVLESMIVSVPSKLNAA